MHAPLDCVAFHIPPSLFSRRNPIELGTLSKVKSRNAQSGIDKNCQKFLTKERTLQSLRIPVFVVSCAFVKPLLPFTFSLPVASYCRVVIQRRVKKPKTSCVIRSYHTHHIIQVNFNHYCFATQHMEVEVMKAYVNSSVLYS